MKLCVLYQIKEDNKGNLSLYDMQQQIDTYTIVFVETRGLPSLRTIHHSVDMVLDLPYPTIMLVAPHILRVLR